MTNEEAKMFLDNLKVCIDEHPVVADWLVEIANRKTENSSEIPNNSTISKMEQVDEPQTGEHCNTCRHKDECEGATYEYKNTEWWCLAYAPIDEPQTDGYMTAEQTEDYRKMLDKAEHKVYGNIEDEPQTDCAWK